jgi:hypothetical protein
MKSRRDFNAFVFLGRARAKIKRKLLQKPLSPHQMTRLEHSYVNEPTSWSRGARYSKNISVEAIHERNRLNWTYAFDERYFFTVKDVTLDSFAGTLFNSRGQIIEESMAWQGTSFLAGSPAIPIRAPRISVDLSGKTPFAITSGNFYHWTLEEFSTALPIITSYPKPVALIYEHAPLFVESILSRLEAEIVRVPRFVKLDECTFLSKNSIFGRSHPKDIDTVREFFASDFRERVVDKKIYISRLQSSRSPRFEEELIRQLQDSGWEIMYPERIPLPEQIQRISSASVLCGVHGAGLTGILWLDPQARAIELSSKSPRACFSFMSQIRGVDFNRIDYETPRMKSADELLAEIISISGF